MAGKGCVGMAGKTDYVERAAARIDRGEGAERGVGHELGQGCTGLLEIGAQAAADLESWAVRRGTFRGLVCKFKKENGVKTGRIQVFPSDAVINPGELPQALDVAGAL